MGRRPLAGRDRKIIQGQRRDEFFKKMRRRGGTPRLPTQGMSTAVAEEPESDSAVTEADAAPVATAEDTALASDEATAEARAEPADGDELAAGEEGATESR